jgi:N-alpha-acetyltransferase 40
MHPKTHEKYSLSLAKADNVSAQDLKTCLALVEETSKSHYETSSRGWKPRNKLAEMKSPELRYILVKDGASSIRGFTSFMPTYEEGQPVIYCYEIHLKPELRGYVFLCGSAPFHEPPLCSGSEGSSERLATG